MPITYQKFILRTDLQANPEDLYVFGDNVQRVGMGGQAAYMRGEPNAVGVATKWTPSGDPTAYFYDSQMDQVRSIWLSDTERLIQHLLEGGKVIWPEDGIGTGLSAVPTYAPKIWEWMEQYRKDLELI